MVRIFATTTKICSGRVLGLEVTGIKLLKNVPVLSLFPVWRKCYIGGVTISISIFQPATPITQVALILIVVVQVQKYQCTSKTNVALCQCQRWLDEHNEAISIDTIRCTIPLAILCANKVSFEKFLLFLLSISYLLVIPLNWYRSCIYLHV